MYRSEHDRPAFGWRTAGRHLTRPIQCPEWGLPQKPAKVCRNQKSKRDIEGIKSFTAGLRFYDMRHHAITELSESQASDQTIMCTAGHIDPRMLAHCRHVRLQRKRQALDAISGDFSELFVTKPVTSGIAPAVANSQVIEKVGGRQGIRTPGLIVANDALSQLS
jgi:hypothetical protein